MRENWHNLVTQIQKLIDDDAAVINGLRHGKDVSKIKRNFERNVKDISKGIEEFGQFVPDPEREEIELPFDSAEFAEAWSDYKEFLFNVWQIVLVPVEERRRLKKLFCIAKKKEERALDFIDFYICSRYKSIFVPKDFQLNNDEPGDEAPTIQPFSIQKKTI